MDRKSWKYVRPRFGLRVYAVFALLIGLAIGGAGYAAWTSEDHEPTHFKTLRNASPTEVGGHLLAVGLGFLVASGVLAHRGWRRLPGTLPEASSRSPAADRS